MQPLSFAVEMRLHVLAFKVVLQDSFLDFLQAPLDLEDGWELVNAIALFQVGQ
jgi:hypothetical protein